MTLPDSYEMRNERQPFGGPRSMITWGERKAELRAKKPLEPGQSNPLMVELLEDGHVLRFPLVCPHCGITYWYRPNEEYGAVTPTECTIAILEEIYEEKENKGSAWWHALWNEAIEQGKKAAPDSHKEPEAATAKEEA